MLEVRLGKSQYAAELLSSNNHEVIIDRSNQLNQIK